MDKDYNSLAKKRQFGVFFSQFSFLEKSTLKLVFFLMKTQFWDDFYSIKNSFLQGEGKP